MLISNINLSTSFVIIWLILLAMVLGSGGFMLPALVFVFFSYLGGSVSSNISLSDWSSQNLLCWVENSLIEVKSGLFNFNYIILFIFSLILCSNYLGLLILLPQIFLSNISLSLLLISSSIWMFTYLPILNEGNENITLFVIGEIKFPPLSLLLSNIEILTHLFRPVTLTARLWVNIWVGHLILSGISFSSTILISNLSGGSLACVLFECFFFLFECLIMGLQTFVFSYLINVYFEENQHHAELVINH